jgi:hypothetical protein
MSSSPTSSRDRPSSQQQQPRSSRPSQSDSSTAAYLSHPITYTVSGILRRLSSDQSGPKKSSRRGVPTNANMGGVYTPPQRVLVPFQPPPLTPLTLSGWRASTKENGRLLTRALAEEIRLLIPASLQLVDEWKLIYSLEQDGVSLSTLYEKCEDYQGKRGGYVLVIRDGMGGVRIVSLPNVVEAHSNHGGVRSLARTSQMSSAPMPITMAMANASSGAQVFFLLFQT